MMHVRGPDPRGWLIAAMVALLALLARPALSQLSFIGWLAEKVHVSAADHR